MSQNNPFTERGRITDATRFTGRWSELSILFDRLGSRRPVLISGVPGVGKSSLLTHVVQSAAINLELPDLRALYFDITHAASAEEVYRALSGAIGAPGTTSAALEFALVAIQHPVLVALDGAEGPISAGWGEQLLEALARVARGGMFLIVAMEGTPPLLSEPFALIRLGALAQPEIRLLTDAYLADQDVTFAPSEIREIADLSAAHPAYVQRAAYHLFESKLDADYDWQAAFRAEARSRPIPGAPLPPAVFEGATGAALGRSGYGDAVGKSSTPPPGYLALPDTRPILALIAPLIIGAIVLALTGRILVALGAVVVSLVVSALALRRR